MCAVKAQLDVEVYGKVGTGRPSPTESYQPTVTYRGRLKNSIEFVAAKSVDIIRKDEAYNNSTFLEAFTHPNIVKFYGWYRTDHHFWFFVEYCPGGTLLELLEQDDSLPEPIIRIFAADILDALYYLHSNGLIVRDIQPRNILLDECGCLKIAELSHAELLTKPSPLGTPDSEMIEYMAPELFTENGVASFSSDLWSLGCLMYRMAAGSPPFHAPTTEETVERIHNSQPPPLVGFSSEFNDLVQSLLNKDFFKRPKWDEVYNSPFWQGRLTKRVNSSLANFDIRSLPEQPRLDRNLQYTSMTKRMSSIILPKIGSEDSSSMKATAPQTIEAMILQSPLFKSSTIFLNPVIEDTMIPPFDQSTLPIKSAIGSPSETERMAAVDECYSALKTIKKRKDKYSIISFLIVNSQKEEVANTIAKSQLFEDVLKLAMTNHASLSSGYLLIFGAVIRFATDVSPLMLTTERLDPLRELVKSSQERVARKAIMALGEVIYYIAESKSMLQFPAFAADVFYDALKNQDDVIRHYAVRAIANVIGLPKARELFDFTKIELVLSNFDANGSPALLDTYATCLCQLYMQQPPSDSKRVAGLCQTLLGTSSSTTRQIGLMLATAVHCLSDIRKDLRRCLLDSTDDLQIKAVLAVCLAFDDDLPAFQQLAARFYYVLDKFVSPMPEVAAAVEWTVSIAQKIVGSDELQLFQILTQALTIKVCRERVWTREFESKLASRLKTLDFTSTGSDYVLQVLDSPVHEGICSLEVITSIANAFESPSEDTQFLALKLIADASANSASAELSEFVIEKLLPLAPRLLEDNALIADQVLKILSFTASVDHNYVPRIATKDLLPRVFSRVASSPSALLLTYHIVQFSGYVIENFVEAGLLKAIIDAVRVPIIPDAFDLLYSVLNPITQQLSINQGSAQLQVVVKMIAPLAELAPDCAARIYENPKILNCMLYEVFIFSIAVPPKRCLIADAYPVLADRIREAVDNADYAQQVKKLIDMMKWTINKGETKTEARAAMQDCQPLLDALKAAANCGHEGLASSCTTLLKLL